MEMALNPTPGPDFPSCSPTVWFKEKSIERDITNLSGRTGISQVQDSPSQSLFSSACQKEKVQRHCFPLKDLHRVPTPGLPGAAQPGRCINRPLAAPCPALLLSLFKMGKCLLLGLPILLHCFGGESQGLPVGETCPGSWNGLGFPPQRSS